jgi:hypothetical protein
VTMAAAGRQETCGDCRHFRGNAADLEAALPGLSSLSSAYASARGEDGICEHHERYVGARSWCDRFMIRE